MISRNHKSLFWQYINWRQVIKYIESLKSRKYETFTKNLSIKSVTVDLSLIKSPMVLLLALQDSFNKLKFQLSEFELGYLLFCLLNIIDLDLNFFYYFRKINDKKIRKRIQALIAEICYSLILLSLDRYVIYLNYISSISSLKINYIDKTYLIKQEDQKYRYFLSFSMKNYMRSSSFFLLLNKINSSKSFINFILNFFSVGYFDNFISDKNSLFFYKNKVLQRVVKIFVLHLYYEISMLYNYNPQIKNLVIYSFYNTDLWLFLFNDSLQWFMFKSKFLKIVSSSEISSKIEKSVRPFFLSEGVSECVNFIFIRSSSYPFNLISRPSIKYQFFLMKQASLILFKSKSVPFFLLIIRLNMLIFLWGQTFFKQAEKKVFYLLDYLISLKLCRFDKSRKSSISYVLNKQLANKRLSIFTFIYHESYYKCYTLLKLFWIHKLKC